MKLISYYAQTKKNSDWLLRCWLGLFFPPFLSYYIKQNMLIYEELNWKNRELDIWDHLLNTCQGVRNVSFTENFAYGLNEWSLLLSDKYCDILTILWFQAIVPGVQKPPNWFLVQTRWQVSSWWKHWSLMWYCHIYIAST